MQVDCSVYVKLAPGVSAEAGRTAIETVTDAYPERRGPGQGGVRRLDRRSGHQSLLLFVIVLLLLAVVIALIGIANTLALSIFERTREIGLLRAVGMTRTQVRSAVRWESVIIALLGTALGLIIGLFFGWALVRALADQGFDTFSVPVVLLVVVVVVAVPRRCRRRDLPGPPGLEAQRAAGHLHRVARPPVPHAEGPRVERPGALSRYGRRPVVSLGCGGVAAQLVRLARRRAQSSVLPSTMSATFLISGPEL